ncbi:MAG: site-specific integrase [Carnobacterium sp.]|uniref:tyrosine-type recombinase/integrase n=1 Tax=Carnobacterium sp. TaxID=48221 RepID=UPI003C7610EF
MVSRRKKELTDEEMSYIPSSKPNDKEAFEIFVTQKRIEGVQERTIELYRQIKHVVERDLKFVNIDKTMVELTTSNIEKLILFWQDNVKTATINSRLRVMKPYYKVLANKKVIKKNPMEHIHMLPERELIKDVLTDEEVSKIADYFKSRKTFANYRNLIIFQLLLDTGIRIGECMNILVSDVREDSITVTLTKNLQERLVFPSPACLKSINSYLKVRGEIEGEQHLFVTVDNKKMSLRSYQDILSTAGRESGVKKNVSPHMCRRTYSRDAVMNGIDPFSLARLLGHSSLNTTKRYVQIWGNDLKTQSKFRGNYDKYF